MIAGNLKLTFPTAIAATQLAWGMIAAPGGFSGSASTGAHLASLKWGTDYLMACRPSSTEFVAQVISSLAHLIQHVMWKNKKWQRSIYIWQESDLPICCSGCQSALHTFCMHLL